MALCHEAADTDVSIESCFESCSSGRSSGRSAACEGVAEDDPNAEMSAWLPPNPPPLHPPIPPPPLHPPPPPLPPRPPYPRPHHPSTDPLPRQVRAHYICLARAGKHKVPPTDPLATLFCNGHMPFSVSLPWLREAVRLDRRRAQALPQAPSNVGRPFSYKRRTRPLWKHPPPPAVCSPY